MARAAAVSAALIISTLMVIGVVAGVNWLMHGPAMLGLLTAAHSHWFTPSMIALNSMWVGLGVPLYIIFSGKSKSATKREGIRRL